MFCCALFPVVFPHIRQGYCMSTGDCLSVLKRSLRIRKNMHHNDPPRADVITKVNDRKTEPLTHWGRLTHICVSKLTIIGSDNGLSPGRREAIIRTNAGIALMRPLRTNFNDILIAICRFSFKEIHFKMWSGKWRPFCLRFNGLIHFTDSTVFIKAIICRSYCWEADDTNFLF